MDNKEIIGNAPPSRIFINRISTGAFSNYDQRNFQIDLGKPFVSKNSNVTASVHEDKQSDSPTSIKEKDDSTIMDQNERNLNMEVVDDNFDNIDIDKKEQETIRNSEKSVESIEKVSSKQRRVGSAFGNAIKGIRRNGNSPSLSKRNASEKKENR